MMLPVKTKECYISQEYGRINSKYAAGLHAGLDFAPKNKYKDLPNIYSVTSGKVIRSQNKGNWGSYIVIRDICGESHIYAHLLERHVKVGDQVKEGQAIGIMGNTGNSSGIHLHYEIQTNYYNAQSHKDVAKYLNINNTVGDIILKEKKEQKVSPFAAQAKAFVKKHNISDGERPQDSVTREEMWVMLERFYKNLIK